MGKWSGNVALEPIEFDGDKVVFTVSRLRVDDMMSLSKHFNQEKGTISFGSTLEVCQVAGEILPKYVVGIAGMTKADGTAMTVEEFLGAAKEFYFVPLIGQLFSLMVQASAVGEVAAKN